ncbi:MAG: hypothetical protein B6244_13010 [Candidatus Cloacimonetes bacterium 4572_55]|nr:MAG: hypothetical protein B6244_13010 [Candidatus Cloacimonetes bacterium 4572_55]
MEKDIRHAAHIKLNPELLTEKPLKQLKTQLEAHSGEQPVFFHILVSGEMIIIKVGNTRIRVDKSALNDIQSMPAVIDAATADEKLSQYDQLKHLFDQKQTPPNLKKIDPEQLNRIYMESVKKSRFNFSQKNILKSSSKIVGIENETVILAFPNQEIMDHSKAEQVPVFLEREFSNRFGRSIRVRSVIDESIHACVKTEPVSKPRSPSKTSESEKISSVAPPLKKKKKASQKRKKKIVEPSDPDEILEKTLEIFNGKMDASLIPKSA